MLSKSSCNFLKSFAKKNVARFPLFVKANSLWTSRMAYSSSLFSSIYGRLFGVHSVRLKHKQNDKILSENNKEAVYFETSHRRNEHLHQHSQEIKHAYETIANETLDSLMQLFDSISKELNHNEDGVCPADYAVTYTQGILNIKLGADRGTYVINKEVHNLQLLLLSSHSGPKRFDFMHNTWIYKRTGESLHGLLSHEISKSLKKPVDFTKCSHGQTKMSK
jgi:iron donor protein CyaY